MILFIYFPRRDGGSLNNIIDSPGAKLWKDRRQADLNVNSQTYHPQTSLWVYSGDTQYSLEKRFKCVSVAFSSADYLWVFFA